MQFQLQQHRENGDIGGQDDPQGGRASGGVQTAVSKDLGWGTYNSSEWQELWLGLIQGT